MVSEENASKNQREHPGGRADGEKDATDVAAIPEDLFAATGLPGTSPASYPLLNRDLDQRYRVTRLLGSGGMGKVYAGVHIVTGKRFAIKVLNPELVHNDEARRRFEREAKAVMAIDHPHIVELYDYGQTPTGVPFITMEYLEGSTLRAFLSEAPATGLPVDQAMTIGLQMAQALQHVHERGVVHRDVKPDNIHIEVDRNQVVVAKLFDFGIARIQSQEAVTGAAAGPPRTLAYAAPEMYERSDYLSPAIDVYALGVTLFEIFTKQRPFSGSGVGLLLAHLKETPPNVSQLRRDVKIPTELDALVARMLAKKPEQRPTMAEISDAMAALTAQLPPTRGLHNLRTYVLPKRLPRRTSAEPGGTPSVSIPALSARPSTATRSLERIEAERQQVGAKLERESRSILHRLFRHDLPPDITPLQQRAAELGTQQGEVELELALLQDTLAQEKATIAAERQALRRKLHGLRDELRAATTQVVGTPSRNIAQELAELELAYATRIAPSALIERVTQQANLQQRLSVELIDVQRELAERLLLAITSVPDEVGNIGRGRLDASRLLFAKRLNMLLSDLDALDESLSEHLMLDA